MSQKERPKRIQWVEVVDPDRITVTGHDSHGIEQITGRVRRTTQPRLAGVPHTARESVLLSAPGLATDYSTVAHGSGLRSDQHYSFLTNLLNVLVSDPVEGLRFFDNLTVLSDPEHVANRAVVVEAQRIRSRMQERIIESGLDLFKPTVNRDLMGREPVSSLRERISQFRRLDRDERHETTLDEARTLLRDPDLVDRRYDAFAAIKQAEIFTDRGEETLAAYESGLSDAIDHVINQEPPPYPTLEGMEHWIGRWVGGNPSAELVLGKLIQEAATPREITNVLYDMALAGFSTGDPNIMRRTAELLTWQSDIMHWKSQQGMDAELARFSIDSQTRQKSNEIHDAALGYLALTSAMGQLRYAANMHRIYGQRYFKQKFARQVIDHPDEMEAMGWDPSITRGGKIGDKIRLVAHAVKAAPEFGERAIEGGLPAVYLSHDSEVGPLGEWLRDYYTSFSTETRAVAPLGRERSVLAHLNFPDQPATEVSKLTAVEASRQVYDHLQSARYDDDVTARTFWNTLGYLAPENLGRTEWTDIQIQNYLLRKEMIEDQRHSLSPRGDRIEMLNDTVKALGFDSIDFAMNPQQKDMTIVTLRVGNATFRCLLDRDYEFREEGTRHNLGLRQHAPFLELVMLSHLYQIYCAEPRTKVQGQVDVGPPLEIVHRRAHRRRLAPGQNPTDEQIIKAADEYGINIPRINRERLARGETRMITWVSEVKPEYFEEGPPVYSKGYAADELLAGII